MCSPPRIYDFVEHSKLYSLNTTFGVGYGIGGVEGTAFRDTVVIGEATGAYQFIGSANTTNGFKLVRPIDGIRMFFYFLNQVV